MQEGLLAVDGSIVILYLLAILALGLWAGKGIKGMTDFSVAGRSFGTFVIFATLSASFIGGGFSVGNAEKVFTIGLINIVALWGFSLKEILVATMIAPKMKNYPDAISVGDIMGHHYGKEAKIFTGFFSLILCAGILGAQIKAMGTIVEVFLDIPSIWGILIGIGIVVAYSAAGGMKAVVYTDVLQFIILSVGIPVTLWLGIRHVGGVQTFLANIPETHMSLEGSGMSWLAFGSLFLTFLLGETLVPPYVQRLFISKDTKHTKRGTLYSGLFSIPFFAVTGLIGLVALQMAPELDAHLSFSYVIKHVLPMGLRGLVVAGVIAIVMSSADSFLNSAAVAGVHDIMNPLMDEKTTDKQNLFAVRMTTIVVGLLSIVFALMIEGVIGVLVYSYNFWAPIILFPLVWVILGGKATKTNFFIGAIAGIVSVLLWTNTLHLNDTFKVDGLIVGVICNVVAFLISLLFIKEKEA